MIVLCFVVFCGSPPPFAGQVHCPGLGGHADPGLPVAFPPLPFLMPSRIRSELRGLPEELGFFLSASSVLLAARITGLSESFVNQWHSCTHFIVYALFLSS